MVRTHAGSTEHSEMNKTELIEHIAAETELSKADAQRALEAMIGGIKSTLKTGGTVSLLGFGSFSVTKREARTGRNPKTGDAMKIKAAKVAKFKAGKGLKDFIK
ncbi:MAG: HU family DNA-binding protein [Burkholderiales bacterium]